ncbi:MAG: Holliday junction branch migration protein RuvA [Acidobacteria bacterium]|nr:Holliday junction branch migration protein RuvA [Acidobacteriota bacterium]
MIGWLRGRVVALHSSGTVVVDVHAVGYEVSLASSEELRVGDDVELFIATQVRADAIVLYGFHAYDDREFFTTLLATPGVGPSTALAALRTMSTERLRAAIEDGDAKLIAQIPGIGAKTANRIVLELRGKLSEPAPLPSSRRPPGVSDIEEALRSLGYAPGEIRDALEGVILPEDESDALRTALQHLRRR